MKELIPNIHEAKKTTDHYFSAYSRAYIVTNEDLRLSMKYMPENCNMALTVAASGDHPLFCSLYGAKHVDTFDISYNAKCLMDIKTAAMKRLNYLEYLDLLEALYNNEDIIHVHNIDKISNELSIIERCYMRSMRGFALFGRGGWDGKGNSCLPKRQEYQKLRELVKQPYAQLRGSKPALRDSSHLLQTAHYVLRTIRWGRRRFLGSHRG